jgi:20S proteasome alpha/beta subunit
VELLMMTKTFSFIIQIIIFWLSSVCTHKEVFQSFPLTFNNEYDEHNADTTKVSHQSISNLIKGNYLKTGTTVVGICCTDGVVLGADTRCTGGPLIVDKNKLKIHPIASRIFCCAAGTSAQCDQVTRQAAQYLALLRVEKEIAGDINYYDDIIAAALVSIKNSLRGSESNKRKLESVFILGGVDAFGPSLFQIDAAGAVNQVGFASLG